MMPRVARPCLRAFDEDAALPASVRGPVESFAFSRLAAICFRLPLRCSFLHSFSEMKSDRRVESAGAYLL